MNKAKILLISTLSTISVALGVAFFASLFVTMDKGISWTIAVSVGTLFLVSLLTTLYIVFYERIQKKKFPVADERQLQTIGFAGVVSFTILIVFVILFGFIDFLGYGKWAPLLVQSEIAVFIPLLILIGWCTFKDANVFYGDDSHKLALKGIMYLLIATYSILNSALDYSNKPLFLNDGTLAITSFNYLLGIFAFILGTMFLIKYVISRKESHSEEL